MHRIRISGQNFSKKFNQRDADLVHVYLVHFGFLEKTLKHVKKDTD